MCSTLQTKLDLYLLREGYCSNEVKGKKGILKRHFNLLLVERQNYFTNGRLFTDFSSIGDFRVAPLFCLISTFNLNKTLLLTFPIQQTNSLPSFPPSVLPITVVTEDYSGKGYCVCVCVCDVGQLVWVFGLAVCQKTFNYDPRDALYKAANHPLLIN